MLRNDQRWAVAKFTRSTQINAQAEKIEGARGTYELVQKHTGVPWDVIGVIHYRESSLNFSGVLHNGEKIIGTGKKTSLVPKGRGPFNTWEQAAIDALMNVHPYAGKNTDWSIAGTLDILERYNGLGYRNKGLPSPYLWAGTDQYVKGKYVKDGVYDPNHVDQQLGVAPILMKLRENAKAATPEAPAKRKTLMDFLRGLFVQQAANHVALTLKENGMNTNFFHNILNVAIAILAGVTAFLLATGCTQNAAGALDCSASFIDPVWTTGITAALGLLKTVINVLRDGFSGLFKQQPPVR